MLRILLIVLAVTTASCEQRSSSSGAVQSEPAGPGKGVDRSHKGKAAPDVRFTDPEGGPISLADFRGVPVLVNLWATWCAPCVKELPTLDKLATARNEDGALGVIAVSQDNAPQGSVTAFLDRLRVDALGPYHDPGMALSGALGAEVLPTTILYDAHGREVWRYVGDLDWTGREAARLLAELRPAEQS